MPQDSQLALATLLFRLLVNRVEAYLESWYDQESGRVHYVKARGPLTPHIIAGVHLAGLASIAVYDRNESGLAKWVAIDVDRGDPALIELLIQRIEQSGIPDYSYVVERTGGRGFHIIIPFYYRIPVWRARWLVGKLFGDFCKAGLAEMLPASSRAELGRALRLPLGRHPRTGRPSVVVWPESLWDLEPIQLRFRPKRWPELQAWCQQEGFLEARLTDGKVEVLCKLSGGMCRLDTCELRDRFHLSGTFTLPSEKFQVRRFDVAKPKGMPPCVQALVEKGFHSEGWRNCVAFNVLQLGRLGLVPEPADLLRRVNARSARPLPEKELEYLIRYHLQDRPRRGLGPYLPNCAFMRAGNLCTSSSKKCTWRYFAIESWKAADRWSLRVRQAT